LNGSANSAMRRMTLHLKLRAKIALIETRLRAEAACAAPAGASARIGRADRGNGLALDHGGDVMWFLPLSITLSVRKTRTGWSVAVRVSFH
jgi:hypothetical protein